MTAKPSEAGAVGILATQPLDTIRASSNGGVFVSQAPGRSRQPSIVK